MVFNTKRTLMVRFERDDSTERYPCREYTVEVGADEVAVMVERDYHQHLATADDPASVERRDPNEILEQEVARPEYNAAKSHFRNTTYRASTPKDAGEPVSVIEGELTSDGYLVSDGFVDPADAWVGEMRIWDAINSLPERDRGVLVDVRLNGFTQAEVAAKYGVSQPVIFKILKRATRVLEEKLS
ncbi:RNA polymerase sigma factor (sigma-70 family) [Arcanobacterium wilhelmae]|uniref:RNA polymerase sigma factor (Sigma-70 family) n=1 Tax=Arcanobacterium wilhelmae TaxID=1803177 RepID=A0ABT9NDB4_9ACTO|nr:sigma-70 family RNA polymerase sigma factor [Arcanobacterium wilhelmae]MDP9801510.1 RNA polymerase sigma factor (sigma-70 family) [Arcanobacterium wilhelmae]